jgi:hypothetical protein
MVSGRFGGLACNAYVTIGKHHFGGSPPFGGWRHHLPPAKAVGLWALGNGVT